MNKWNLYICEPNDIFGSDAAIHTVDLIAGSLPADGRLELRKIVDLMRSEQEADSSRLYFPDVKECHIHTGPMVLVEMMVKLQERDFLHLDYGDDWEYEGGIRFCDMISFTADRASLEYLRAYLSEAFECIKESAALRAQASTAECDRWGGWPEESAWLDWQKYMSSLIARVDTFLEYPERRIEIIPPQEQEILLEPQM